MTRKSPSKGNPGSSFDNASKHMIPDGDDADLGLNSVLSASTQECIEISEDELALEQGLGIGLSESMLAAQKEADEIADAAEADTSNTAALVDENAALPAMPRLLQLPKQDLVAKTQELQNRGEQLDLLLLKAESYSKFILDNQKKSKMAALAELGVDTLADGADNANPENPSSGGKKRVGGNEAKSRTKKASKSSTGDSSPGQENSAESSTTENDGSVSTYGGTIIMRQPESLKGGQLMSYQLEGLQWLLSLWENGLSGILADEMGLGKTIQIISLIAHLRAHDTPGPFMIVGPLATLPNWINEFKKWLPSCPVVLYHGAKAERQALRKQHMPIHASKGMQFPVVITSFEICMIDRPHLERYTWQYMILDEGHRIKNRQCKLLRELKQIRTISRLLLTGTPIQNTLEELWSLLNFCSPNIFDNLEVFQSWFGFRNIGTDTQVDDIVSTEHKQRVVSKLHEILRPFLLRRMKADVLLTMPPKREVVVYCGMSSLQREFSHMILNKTLTKQMLNELGIEGSGGSSSAGSGLMNPTMQLRKAANHPFLFGEPKDEQGRYLSDVNPKLLIMASGKLRLLDRMLVRLKRDGHKVLIFSQMTEMLNILEDYLTGRGWGYCRLDGSTALSERQANIDAFQKNPSKYNKENESNGQLQESENIQQPELFVFLLSTRAGGLGINLTAADTVVLLDSDWNPHADSQAQDRCHRIGQTKPVVTYRLLTAGSIEIDMMAKQISKKKLERLTVIGGDYRRAGERAADSQLTLAKLRQLLEDDVKNLTRMSKIGTISSAELLANTDTNAAATTATQGRGVMMDIQETELNLIMDRSKLFPYDEVQSPPNGNPVGTTARYGACSLPSEGIMYDIIELGTGVNVLNAVHYTA